MANRYKDDKDSSIQQRSTAAIDVVKKYIWMAVIIVVFSLLAGYTYKLYVVPAMHTKEVSVSCDFEQGKALDKLNKYDKVEQVFHAVDDEISGFSVKFATFQQVTNGVLEASLKDLSDNKILYSNRINVNEIVDNEYKDFIFDETINGALNHEFAIALELIEADESTKLSLWSLKNDVYPEGKLYINGNEIQDSNICFRVTAGENLFLKPMYIIAVLIIGLSLLVLYYLSVVREIKIEHLFLISALILGVAYMMLFPPFSVPDEGTHIGSSYKYSNVVLGYGFDHNGSDYVREDDFAKVPLYKTPKADTYRYVGENLFTACKSTNMKETSLPYAGNVCQYIFSTAGVTLARVLNFGYLPTLMLGRIFNFAFFIGLVYIAIKRIPFGKAIICSVALMPMTMSLAMSFSYDSVINTLAIFFISTVLYICYSENQIRWWDIALLSASGGLLVAAKAGVYIFICLMILMIPMKRFKKKTDYSLMIVISLASCAVFMIAFNLINVINASTLPNAVESMDAYIAPKQTYSIASIFASPGTFVKIFVDTVNSKSEFYIFSLLGYRLGWLNITIPVYLPMITFVVLLLSSFKLEAECQFIKPRTKFLLGLICAAVFCIFVVVAYTWTPQGESIIEGVQGRYLIPILPIFLLLFRNRNLTFKKDISRKLMYTMCLVNVITLTFSFQQIISGKLINVV